MFEPKISIIIPVYNGGNFMREAIDSALMQTYKNKEVIVVNDGSPDGGETDAIARSYGDKIIYVPKENGGSSSALNEGIRHMTGDYFSWLSHDDLYMPTRTEEMVRRIRQEEADVQAIVCGDKLIDAEGKPIPHPKKQLSGEFSGREMLQNLQKGLRINGCGILIPKILVEKVGFFDETLRYVNDTDYWYRLIIAGCKFTCFTEPLVATRIHGKQVTVTHSSLFATESARLCQKVFEALLKDTKNNMPLIKVYRKKAAIDGNLPVLRNAAEQLHLKIGEQISLKTEMYVFFLYGKGMRFAKKVYKKLFFKR